MSIQNQKLTIGAVIVLCVCISAVSGATVTAQGGAIASVGNTEEFPIVIDSLPLGLSGFNITVALSDPAKAEITGITFPSWAGDGIILAGSGPLPADSVWIMVVDLHGNVQHGATNVELASLGIRGDATGSTGFLLSGIQIDDEEGDPVPYTIVNGTITIGSTPPPMVNGTVQVQSTPTGADVILDGAGKGTTPLTIFEVGAGVHTLRLEKDGYYPHQESIEVNAGLTTNVTWILTEIPAPVVNGTVQVQSTPTGADVILDGAGKGTTPLTIFEVGAGVHTLRLEKDGYYPWENPVIVVAGETANVVAVLSMVPPATGSVAVQSDPEEANVYLDTVLIGLSPVSIGNVAPGPHTIHVEKDGYESREVNTTVAAGATTIVSVALVPVPPPTSGSLEVQSDPTGSNVYVDMEFKGISPLPVSDLDPGIHTVRVEKDGYIPYENTSVSVTAGAVTQVYALLDPVPLPETGEIEINSNPSGAAVYLDGVLKGPTPLTITNLNPQSYMVRIEKSGYMTWEENVTIAEGETAMVLAELVPIPTPTPTPTQTPTPIPTTTLKGTGGLLVVSEPTATVFVDGMERGKSNEVIGDVTAGTRNVTLVKAGYTTTSFPVTIPVTRVAITAKIVLELGAEPTMPPTMVPATPPTTMPTLPPATIAPTIPPTSGPFPPVPLTGSIFVYSVPFGCSAYLDGGYQGTSPGIYSLIEPGTHELRIARAGYFDDVRSVTVNAGDITTVLVIMIPDVGSVISAFL